MSDQLDHDLSDQFPFKSDKCDYSYHQLDELEIWCTHNLGIKDQHWHMDHFWWGVQPCFKTQEHLIEFELTWG